MKTLIKSLTGQIFLFLAVAGISTTAFGQTTALWTGPAGDEWNTAADWDQLIVPGPATNIVITGGSVVNYNVPMTAPSIGTLALSGSLTLNAAGFNIDAGGTNPASCSFVAGSVLNITSSGVATIANTTNTGVITIAATATVTNSGSLTFSNSGPITLANNTAPGTAITLNAPGVFIMTNTPGSAGINVGSGSSSSQGAIFTINGGTATFDKLLTVQGTSSRVFVNGGTLNCLGGSRINDIGNDGAQRIAINGATANLGNFSVFRSTSAGGLIVSNGIVNATGIQIGVGNAAAFSTIGSGGILTNTGVFTISDNTNAAASGDRRSQFLVRGGTVVSTDVGGVILGNQSNTNPAVTVANANIGGVLDVNAGSLTVEKITLIKDATITNAYARLNLSGTGIIYLGSGGMVGNVGVSKTAFNVVPSGGTFAAKADWSSSVPMAMSGTVTFQAADALGAAHNITLSGVLSGGSAVLNKTGAGTLILDTNDTYAGNTIIAGGTLALSANGAIASTAQILLTNNGNFDVSAVAGAHLSGSQILSGQGSVTGSLTANSGNTIRPGGVSALGTITFSNSFSESGGVVNGFDLSTNTTIGSNDFINIANDLNLSGTNTIQINPIGGPLPANTTYTLIKYGGSLATGGVTNLSLSGASGFLTNDPTAKAILLIISSGVRGSTNVTWIGSAANSNWDLLSSSNWLNGVSRDYFVSGDSARFADIGATNPIVTVVGSVLPGSMVVDSASNYTFTGTGTIDGSGGLIKTNSGTLSILTLNNNYPGATIINQGTVEAAKLAAAGAPSSLGVGNVDPANLQFFGSTLRYLGGNASTDRGATLNGPDATLDVASNATTLTVSGNLVGSAGLTKSGPGSLILSGTSPYAGLTTVSNGTLQINGSTVAALATNAVNLAGGTLFLNVSGQPTYANALNVVTNSSVNVAGNNTLFTGDWSGSATMNVNVNGGGFFTINAAMSTNFTGTIAMGNSGGLLRFNGGGGNPCIGSDSVTFDLGISTNALVNRNGASVTYHLGALAGGSATQLRGSENTGTPSIYMIGSNNVSTTFAGTIKTGNGGAGATAAIIKVGAGMLTLSGSNSYNASTTISGGTLALSGSGSIDSTPTILVFTNTVLDVSTRTNGTLTLTSVQTLQGSGTVRGSVTVTSGSTLSVGDDANIPETLVITNVLVLQSNSTLNMDVDHYQTQGGATNDVIQGLASITYGGTLNLNVLSIETNSVFKLFSAGSYNGVFSSIVPAQPPLPTGWVWDTRRLAVDGTLRVMVPQPVISSVDFSTLSGGSITINATNGIPFGPFSVLSSTNVALPLASWTAITNGNFDGSGSVTTPVTVDPTKRRQFFILSEP